MPFKMSCPSCKAVAVLPDAARGKKCRCPKCGGVIDASRAASAAVTRGPAAPVAAAPVLTAPTIPGRRLKSSGKPTLVLAALALLPLFLICGGGLALVSWYLAASPDAVPVAVMPDPAPTAARTVPATRPATRRERLPEPPTRPAPPEDPEPKVEPPAPGTPAARLIGRWANDSNFRYEFHVNGKCDSPSLSGGLDTVTYRFLDADTVLMGAAPGSGKTPQKLKVVFHSDNEFSFTGNQTHYVRIGPALLGGVEEKRIFRLGEGDHESVAISKDRKFLAASIGQMIRVYNLEDGTELAPLKGHKDRVTSLAFLRDGTLVSLARDQTMRLWTVATGKASDTIPQLGSALSMGVISPDGKFVASVGVRIEVNVFELATQKDVASLGMDNNAAICSVAFSPDGKWLAVSGDHYGKLFSIPGFTETARLPLEGVQSQVALAFSPDSKTLAMGTSHVRLLDVGTHAVKATLDTFRGPARVLAFSPDGGTLAVASGKWVRLWDVTANKPGPLLIGHYRDVQSLSWSNDGKLLASGGWDQNVHLWAMPGGFR